MADLPVDTPYWHYTNALRTRARTLLRQGEAPSSLGYGLSPDALSVLYKLASSRDSAEDGLKLLHELQTHQVELDLQHEQSIANEHETAAELARYKALYDFAPTGYLLINREGRILQSNRSAAELLGTNCDAIDGSLFEASLTSDSRSVFSWQLQKLFNGTARESCTVRTSVIVDGHEEKEATLRVHAALAPDGETVLVNLSEQEHPQPA